MTELNRRQFSAAAMLSGMALPNGHAIAANAIARSSVLQMPTLKPPRLRPGATVGLIAPGGVVDQTIVDKCTKNLEGMGFKVKMGKNILERWGGYAGTVGQRLADLHAMFADPDVAAIWTARGGSGCAGLLPHIRYDWVRAHPKIVIGYSDITALNLALFARAGLVTFHGPVAWSTFSDYSVACMRAVLMPDQVYNQTAFEMAPENAARGATEAAYQMRTFSTGVAEGVLTGGNLSVLTALVGTPYAAQLPGSLLFLEDVREEPYRIDRMLHQLQQSLGGFDKTSGVMLGVFSRSEASDKSPALSLTEVLDGHFSGLPVPAVYGYSIGHISQQLTLPIGIRARLDTNAQTLTLLEAAVTE